MASIWRHSAPILQERGTWAKDYVSSSSIRIYTDKWGKKMAQTLSLLLTISLLTLLSGAFDCSESLRSRPVVACIWPSSTAGPSSSCAAKKEWTSSSSRIQILHHHLFQLESLAYSSPPRSLRPPWTFSASYGENACSLRPFKLLSAARLRLCLILSPLTLSRTRGMEEESAVWP